MRGGFLPPVPLPRRLWAGGSLDFTGDLRMGGEMRGVWRIADGAEKEGRTGAVISRTSKTAAAAAPRIASP